MGRVFDAVATSHTTAPQVVVKQVSRRAGPASGRWFVAWRIQNLGQHPIELLRARLPHSLFRGDDREVVGQPKLAPGDNVQIEFSVACGEAPGSVIENAFLILRALWLGKDWWVFARLRVVIDSEGGPQAETETVTAHPVGFSG